MKPIRFLKIIAALSITLMTMLSVSGCTIIGFTAGAIHDHKTPDHDQIWSRDYQLDLEPGSQVKIDTVFGDQITGRFLSYSEDAASLTITRDQEQVEVPLSEIAAISAKSTPQHIRGYDAKRESESSYPQEGERNGYQRIWSLDFVDVKPDTRVQIVTTNAATLQGRYREFNPLTSEVILEQDDEEMRIGTENIQTIAEKISKNSALTGALVGAALDATFMILAGNIENDVWYDWGDRCNP